MTIVIEHISHNDKLAWCQFHDTVELITRRVELSWADIDRLGITSSATLLTAIEIIRQKMIWIETHPTG